MGHDTYRVLFIILVHAKHSLVFERILFKFADNILRLTISVKDYELVMLTLCIMGYLLVMFTHRAHACERARA
jgi:hypothetical protein